MAFAIDRKAIIDNITQTGQIPATGFVPKGMPGFDTISAKNYLEPTSDMTKAKAFMAKVKNPVTNVNLFVNNAPGNKEVSVAIQSYWKQLGLNVTIKQMDWPQFLQFLGPPPDKSVTAYRSGWVADFPDAVNFLELWMCKSGNNNSNFCDPAYDALVNKAKQTPDDKARWAIYQQAEAKLTGPDGAMPIVPVYWYTYSDLQKPNVKGYTFNPMDNTDLTKVSITS
jgi:ABC-type oligopeptide transport system substrate-binding subunit